MTWGVTGVSVRFGAVTALTDVDLVAAPGTVVGVVGGDGAGKSTLLRVLVGEVAPQAGEVRVPANPGYLPASAGSWADLSVAENIEFVGAAYGLDRPTLTARADRLLTRAGLADARDRLAHQLSGGMRRKLGFCLAMLAEPQLLVLDEPSTGVDPVSRVDLWRLVSEAAAGGAAVVMATTYLDEAERCTQLIALDEGVVLVSGTPAEALGGLRGTVVATRAPVDRERAWRRGRGFHEWWPPGEDAVGDPIVADLEDVVVAASLARRAGVA